MMKLLLAVIATCALVVSPTCIKIKHQLRSNAPTIHVLISNGNTQMTSQVARDGSHRFTTDNLSNMTLAPAGTQTVTLSYDEIFPITDAAVCTEVHPLSAGGCADGVCCKISISMYTITDAIIMTARVNNKNADGNPQFWKCEQEIQVPGVTNTEPTGEEIAAEILHGEDSEPAAGEIGGLCGGVNEVQCGDNAECASSLCKCETGFGLKSGNVDLTNCYVNLNRACTKDADCGDNTLCPKPAYLCDCKAGYEIDGATNCKSQCLKEETCKQKVDGADTGNTCTNRPSGYICTCDTDYYADTGAQGSATCTEKKDNDVSCTANKHEQCKSNLCHGATPTCKACENNGQCSTGTCTGGVCV